MQQPGLWGQFLTSVGAEVYTQSRLLTGTEHLLCARSYAQPFEAFPHQSYEVGIMLHFDR